VRGFAPDVIVTAFDRILDPEAVAAFPGKLLNLHYSLLPAFGGTTGSTPIRLALEKGCRILGTTVHLVVAEVDAGPILAQSALPARAEEAFDRTVERVFRSGAVNLAGALRRFGDGSARTADEGWSHRADLESFFSPAVGFPDGAFADAFWNRVS
jgi:phosphoribosylglycinamide formyltransferase-1